MIGTVLLVLRRHSMSYLQDFTSVSIAKNPWKSRGFEVFVFVCHGLSD